MSVHPLDHRVTRQDAQSIDQDFTLSSTADQQRGTINANRPGQSFARHFHFQLDIGLSLTFQEKATASGPRVKRSGVCTVIYGFHQSTVQGFLTFCLHQDHAAPSLDGN